MRILQVDVNYDYSSTGKIVKDLEERLQELGHQVSCCYGRDVENLPNKAVKVAKSIEVYTHAAFTRITGLTGIYSPFATIKLIAQIKYFKPDVVHLHELHGYYLNIGSIIEYLKLSKIPTLWTFHCEFMYTGKCGYAYDCERWKKECGSCPQLSEYPASLFFDATHLMHEQKRVMFSDFDRLKIVTPSKWLADRVRQSFLCGKDIDVVYNGIDTQIFRPRLTDELRMQLGIKTKHVLVSIAPDLLSERKGGGWVLELARRMNDDDVTFVMVGVDRPEMIAEPNVISLPRINDKILLSKYYSLGDFFLLTSKKETFSLVCAESLACGTPIIGFDAGAPTEVAPTGYGHFVEYGNLSLLHEAVLRGLRNRSNFKSSKMCAEYASEKFGKDIMINAYLSRYETMLRHYKVNTGS